MSYELWALFDHFINCVAVLLTKTLRASGAEIFQGNLHGFGVVPPGFGHFAPQADILQRQVKAEAVGKVTVGDPGPADLGLEASTSPI
jgi:hypothetical protein